MDGFPVCGGARAGGPGLLRGGASASLATCSGGVTKAGRDSGGSVDAVGACVLNLPRFLDCKLDSF